MKRLLVAVFAMCAMATSAFAGPEKGTYFSSGVTNTTPESDAYGTVVRPIGGTGADELLDVQKIESQFEYEAVAASQTDQVMGTTGAAGDLLHAVHCVWTAAPATVTSIKDGAGAAINIFEVKGSAGSQTVILDLVSADGGWKLTTSTNMTCIGIGRFS